MKARSIYEKKRERKWLYEYKEGISIGSNKLSYSLPVHGGADFKEMSFIFIPDI